MFYSKHYLMSLNCIIKLLSRCHQLAPPPLEHECLSPTSPLSAQPYLGQAEQVKKEISLSFYFAGKDGPFSSHFLRIFTSVNCRFMFFTIFLSGSWYFSYWSLGVIYIFMMLIICHIYDKDLPLFWLRLAFQCGQCFIDSSEVTTGK